MRIFASLLVVLFLTKKLWSSETCSIEIDGLIYHHGECRNSEDLGSDRYWTIEIGQVTADNALGSWALLFEREDGSFEGHWNGSYGTTRSHNRLGVLKKTGDCWVGERARLCLSVQNGNLPIYRVVRDEQSPTSHVVQAIVNGKRYVIDHYSWDMLVPYRIGGTTDFDGEGYPEAFVYVYNNGNSDPGWFTLISYRGNGFFSVVNDEPISSGWLGLEMVFVSNEVLFRVHDQYLGFGGYQDHETKTDYALQDGELVKLVECLNVSVMPCPNA